MSTDLNIPWRHEVRIEDRLKPEARKTYPVCTGGDGACPPEDCGGPESFMDHRDDRFSFDALEDLDTMVEVFQHILVDEMRNIILGVYGTDIQDAARQRGQSALTERVVIPDDELPF